MASRLRRPDDLLAERLLHETPRRDDWTAWLAQFPVSGLDLRESGEDFPNLDLAVRAALLGTGVVMADRVLCRDELEAGTLVQPFAHLQCLSPLGSVSLIGPEERWETRKVRAFRDWVRAEADATR